MNELMITLNTKSKMPLYEQIYQYIKHEIQSGNLVCGARIPSTRALSAHLDVSRSTVDLAYEQLLSEGYIESVPCKGFYVSQLEGLYRLLPERKLSQPAKKQKQECYRYDFSPRGIDLHSFPYNIWRKLSKEVLLDERTGLLKSGDSRGEEGLRDAIRSYLHQARGVNCSSEQIIVGAGNEYLLMLLSMMIGTNHRIAFESPTYLQAYRVFQNLGLDVTTVDMDEYGMQTEGLEKSGADLAYVMPSHQYPLGIVMPMKRRMQLLRWANEKEGRFVIEDDYDSEFRYKGKPIPALQGHDVNGRVVYLGTFSKSIAPAIRVSYMVLPQELLAIYKNVCGFMNCTVPKPDQMVVEQFIRQGHYERHLNKMRALYKGRHDVLLAQLKPLAPYCRISGEHAGVHLLLSFPQGKTEAELIRVAAEHQIKVYGLSGYIAQQKETGSATILLGYANMLEEDIIEATKVLCEVWK